jgi:GNAT superfamily N-acetyltransferase
VMPMHAAAVAEERGQAGTPQYPAVPSAEAVAHEYGRVLIGSLDTPGFGAFVAAPVGRKVKGYVIGRLCSRVLGEPKLLAVGEMIYVDPAFRDRGLSHALAAAFWAWGQEHGAAALEAQHIPGSIGEQIWLAAGFRPYLVRTVYADPQWRPRQDMPHRPVATSHPERESA